MHEDSRLGVHDSCTAEASLLFSVSTNSALRKSSEENLTEALLLKNSIRVTMARTAIMATSQKSDWEVASGRSCSTISELSLPSCRLMRFSSSVERAGKRVPVELGRHPAFEQKAPFGEAAVPTVCHPAFRFPHEQQLEVASFPIEDRSTPDMADSVLMSHLVPVI